MLGGMKDQASAHMSKALMMCPIFVGAEATEMPKLIGVKSMENGIYVEIYDVNGDGKADIAVYSAIIGGAEEPNGEPLHKEAPILYEIDIDGDEEGDLLYIDPVGNQECSDLVIYSDEAAGGLASWKTTKLLNEILIAMRS